MNHPETDISLREYKKVHDYLNLLTFKENDVRLEYFQLMSSIYDRFHKGFAVMDFLREIADKKILKEMILNNESYKYIFVDCLDKDHYTGYFSDSSRRFIIDSWSIFELTITQLLDFLLDATSKEKFLNKEFNQLKYVIDSEIDSGEKKKKIYRLLKNGQFIKKHITHQSINRRYSKLFSILKSKYCRNIDDDKKFLSFLGVYRNGLHYNFVYSGESFNYLFENLFFKFVDGELIQIPKEPWELRIINELIDITKEIFNCVNNDFIESKISYAT